jgi:hypothetical protein
MIANGFFKMPTRAAERLGMEGVHPHLLHHACSFQLMNRTVDTRTRAATSGIGRSRRGLATPRWMPGALMAFCRTEPRARAHLEPEIRARTVRGAADAKLAARWVH